MFTDIPVQHLGSTLSTQENLSFRTFFCTTSFLVMHPRGFRRDSRHNECRATPEWPGCATPNGMHGRVGGTPCTTTSAGASGGASRSSIVLKKTTRLFLRFSSTPAKTSRWWSTSSASPAFPRVERRGTPTFALTIASRRTAVTPSRPSNENRLWIRNPGHRQKARETLRGVLFKTTTTTRKRNQEVWKLRSM